MPLPQYYNYKCVGCVCKCYIFLLFMPFYCHYMVGGALPRPYNVTHKHFAKLKFTADLTFSFSSAMILKNEEDAYGMQW